LTALLRRFSSFPVFLTYSFLTSYLLHQYDGEFIVHGAVGYLTHFYIEHVYGEEDGKFR
jgi:hypothetical protein